jgi:hypothetical protein
MFSGAFAEKPRFLNEIEIVVNARRAVFRGPKNTALGSKLTISSELWVKAISGLSRLMTKRVRVALRAQREKGAVRSDQGPAQYVLGEVVR